MFLFHLDWALNGRSQRLSTWGAGGHFSLWRLFEGTFFRWLSRCRLLIWKITCLHQFIFSYLCFYHSFFSPFICPNTKSPKITPEQLACSQLKGSRGWPSSCHIGMVSCLEPDFDRIGNKCMLLLWLCRTVRLGQALEQLRVQTRVLTMPSKWLHNWEEL